MHSGGVQNILVIMMLHNNAHNGSEMDFAGKLNFCVGIPSFILKGGLDPKGGSGVAQGVASYTLVLTHTFLPSFIKGRNVFLKIKLRMA